MNNTRDYASQGQAQFSAFQVVLVVGRLVRGNQASAAIGAFLNEHALSGQQSGLWPLHNRQKLARICPNDVFDRWLALDFAFGKRTDKAADDRAAQAGQCASRTITKARAGNTASQCAQELSGFIAF